LYMGFTMNVSIERFITGPLETNTYVVSSGSACLIVDPSSGCGKVAAFIDEHGLKPEAICLTHGHFDHIMGIAEIKSRFGNLGVWAHPDEKILLTNPEYNGSFMIGANIALSEEILPLSEGEMTIGSFTPTVLHIPGHSPGGVAYVFGKHCLCGDSLFAGSIGRTDFPGCDPEALVSTIRAKLFSLPDDTIVYPGHMNRTTIGREKRSNPFLS
jgi:hydroxyacylglutathione hydrolase